MKSVVLVGKCHNPGGRTMVSMDRVNCPLHLQHVSGVAFILFTLQCFVASLFGGIMIGLVVNARNSEWRCRSGPGEAPRQPDDCRQRFCRIVSLPFVHPEYLTSKIAE